MRKELQYLREFPKADWHISMGTTGSSAQGKFVITDMADTHKNKNQILWDEDGWTETDLVQTLVSHGISVTARNGNKYDAANYTQHNNLPQTHEDKMWGLIEGFDWKVDHNYKRISLQFSLLSAKKRVALAKFAQALMDELDNKFRKDWLAKPGIPVSDDGWSDLRAEVIGRGRKFYNLITVPKLKQMGEAMDYTENFMYGLDMIDNPRHLHRYHELLKTIMNMENTTYAVKSEYHRIMYTYCLEMELLQQLLTTK